MLSMQRLLIILAVSTMLLACSPIDQQPPLQPQPPTLTAADVAQILSAAIKDIQSQGYEPLFLNEQRGYIWCRAQDGSIKLYKLDSLIKTYQDRKQAKPPENSK